MESPDPADQDQWCFPDTEEGILSALEKGATHLWANTVLFAEHPLQISSRLTPFEFSVKIIGQPPLCADRFDDKSFVNDALRRHGGLTLPRSWNVDDPNALKESAQGPAHEHLDRVLASIQGSDYPIVAKPVRGRGSHGVKICRDSTELADHVALLFGESPQVLLEEYLTGEEGTITIMPPSHQLAPGSEVSDRFAHHWALPPVTRFNHVDGIAPYSGKVAVTVNSRAVFAAEIKADSAYAAIMEQCETVGSLLQTAAPLRIDIRRFRPNSTFALFDINMKPVRHRRAGSGIPMPFADADILQNITGPGRPGRDDQTSLMGLAAESIGWDYPTFLQYVLGSARELGKLREYAGSLLG